MPDELFNPSDLEELQSDALTRIKERGDESRHRLIGLHRAMNFPAM
jgi:hypothetical protein